VIFWDLFGEKGHPVRATVSEMGPLLLSRLLELSEAQEGVLNVAFRLSDEEELPLLDLKDLQALLTFVAENAAAISARYGLVSPRNRSARSSGGFWCWKMRAAPSCSASRRWILLT
jgi:uncharacterized protein